MTTLPPFTVHRAASIEDASALLDDLGDDAVVYCGGTELLLVYRFGFADFPDLVDVKAIEELRGIAVDGDELRIGAATTHRQIERSPLVTEHLPALVDMERHIGNIRVRTQGTIGGNLCFADPHSDPATFLMAAGGAVSLRRGGAATRRLPIEAFVLGPYTTALQPGELLVAVHVPRLRPGAALVHRKLSFHERPTLTVAARVTAGGGQVTDVRLAVGSVGSTPALVPVADALVGQDAAALGASALHEAGAAAAEAARPVEDENGSAEYKRELVRVISARALREAATRALAA